MRFFCLLVAAGALHAGDALVLETRVVEARTGKPVPGAEVRFHHEVEHPGPGPRAPVFTARSDADGRVRVARADLPAALRDEPKPWDWAYVEAEGYAPNALFASSPDTAVVELQGPADLEVLVRDLLDRPVAGARLSWILGCGHAPDAREAVTGPDGTAWLRGIQREGKGQVWVVAEGLLSDYADPDALGTGRVRHSPDWAYTVTGRVVTHDGKPAEGVAVGGHESHRGPWTRTDAEGRFRLAGLVREPGQIFCIEPFDGRVPKARAAGTSYAVAAPPHDVALLFRLPAPGAEQVEEPAECRIVVDLRDENGMNPEAALHLLAVREADGLTLHGLVAAAEETGLGWIDVPAGSYLVILRLSADGAPAVAERRGRATVEAGSGAYVRLPPPRAYWAAVRRAEDLPDGVEAALVAEGWRRLLDMDEVRASATFPVPPDRPVFLRVASRGEVSIVPVRSAPDPDAAEPAVIEPPPAHR